MAAGCNDAVPGKESNSGPCGGVSRVGRHSWGNVIAKRNGEPLSASCFQPARGIRQGKLLLFPDTKVKRVPLPQGDRGIEITIGWMRRASSDGARNPQVRQLALQIVRGVANKDSAGELAAIYEWVKQNIRFRGEWDETIQAPEVTLKFGAGDCDDHSVLLCALLGSIGYRCRFKTVAVRGERDFTHVYAEALDPASGWTALDTTVDQAYPGWEPPDLSREKEWKALGNLGTARLRTLLPRRRRNLRGLGNEAATIAADINAASPLVNAIADVNAQNYYRSLYGGIPGQFPVYSGIGLNYQPGNIAFTSSAPSWLWPAALLLGGGLLLSGLRRGKSR